jgi:7-carboxy-7-deazaguanine synthase (Cx14CxxC type)
MNRSGYTVKEIYYTIQGEGGQAGRPAVFCRFVGCNLWSGREQDRATAICQFCDTNFVGVDGPSGGAYEDADHLAATVEGLWPSAAERARRFVVFTGGEPLLQLDGALVDACHDRGFEVAIETNGTKPAPPRVDWICVSPKAGSELVLHGGDELKLVFPQPGAEPERFERMAFDYFFLQPMDGPNRDENTRLAIRYCLEHPQWRLSIQRHKLLGLR